MQHVPVAFVFVSCLLMGAPHAWGQESPAAQGAQEASPDEKKAAEDTINKQFLGIEFGLGLGFTVDISAGDRVEEAEVVNGVVRLTKTSNVRPRILLETHYFFEFDAEDHVVDFGGRRIKIRQADIGMGPFVAIQGSDQQVLEAIAFGYMIGFKRSESSSLNLGFGLALDPDVKTLGSGLEADKPLPAGETEIRYRQEGRWGIVGLASFSF